MLNPERELKSINPVPVTSTTNWKSAFCVTFAPSSDIISRLNQVACGCRRWRKLRGCRAMSVYRVEVLEQPAASVGWRGFTCRRIS